MAGTVKALMRQSLCDCTDNAFLSSLLPKLQELVRNYRLQIAPSSMESQPPPPQTRPWTMPCGTVGGTSGSRVGLPASSSGSLTYELFFLSLRFPFAKNGGTKAMYIIELL